MSENTVFVKRYRGTETGLDEVSVPEVWRYAGFPGGPGEEDEPLRALLDEILEERGRVFRYEVCYRRVELRWEGDMPVLPFPSSSADLARCLRGSTEAVMMAATVGLGPDREIARNARTHPAKALLWQALGAERVEALCDAFCRETGSGPDMEGRCLTPRFSPGYGDLPLETQKDFIRLLDCGRQIGVFLGAGLLMSPSKSVTAIFGIRPAAVEKAHAERGARAGESAPGRGCGACGKNDCIFRV